MDDDRTVIIIADDPSPRLTYVLDEVFCRRLNLKYKLRSFKDDIHESDRVIYYTSKPTEGLIQVYSEGLLSETDIRETFPVSSVLDNLPVLFESSSQGEYSLPFDIFSAIFFCLSRYEEYVVEQRDQHGRFEAKSSIFYGHHRMPYLDRWIDLLKKLLEENFGLSFEKPHATWVNTMDMDIAFAYKGRSLYRTLGATAKDMLSLNGGRLSERLKVLSGGLQDPFDTYSTFLNAQNADEKWLFVPTGKRGELDNNLDVSTPIMRSHISDLANQVDVGLHPSYASLGESSLVASEKMILEEIKGGEVRASRQHFLRFELPESFNILDSQGISDEFSMGFHDDIGFRAGTAFPFKFYDLKSNEERSIILHPLIAMDSALKNYLQLTPAGSIRELKDLLSNMSSTGGAFITVWHNHSLSDQGDWEGWLEVYRSLSDLFSSQG